MVSVTIDYVQCKQHFWLFVLLYLYIIQAGAGVAYPF